VKKNINLKNFPSEKNMAIKKMMIKFDKKTHEG
jgi:hypothetical protein